MNMITRSITMFKDTSRTTDYKTNNILQSRHFRRSKMFQLSGYRDVSEPDRYSLHINTGKGNNRLSFRAVVIPYFNRHNINKCEANHFHSSFLHTSGFNHKQLLVGIREML